MVSASDRECGAVVGVVCEHGRVQVECVEDTGIISKARGKSKEGRGQALNTLLKLEVSND